jgi:hypothetical protein
MNLSKNTKLTIVKAGTSTGGGAIDTDSVDMQGFEGVRFFGVFETADAGNFASIEQSSDDGSSDDFTGLLGTKVVPGDSADAFSIDVYRPEKRYVRAAIIRAGADTVLGEIYALQYGAKSAPTTQGSTVDHEDHISPIEGTI